jgi:RNA polymerase sigma factor (sigma-70 family)
VSAAAEPGPLLAAAAAGDEQAWHGLVERYAPLVASVIRAHRLDRADAADVNQTVWLRLVEHLGTIREPAALAGWLATTTRRECYRVVRMSRPVSTFDRYAEAADPRADPGGLDDHILRVERRDTLRAAFALLPPRCRQLLTMALADPPASHREIGERLGMPLGSVGPTHGRCLRKLRDCPALAALVDGGTAATRERPGVTGSRSTRKGGDRDDTVAAGR